MNDLKHSDGFNNQHMYKGVMAMNSDMQMDLNDVEYDDFLTNYKTNDKSEVKDIIIRSNISFKIYKWFFINKFLDKFR